MKTAFYWLLAIWIGGGIMAGIVAAPSAQAMVVNLFGIPAIIVGIILVVRWFMNRDKPPATKPD